MKLPIIVGVLLALLFAISNAFAAKYEQRRFLHPVYQGYRLDWCQEGACGGAPAGAWCRWKGYDSAVEFMKASAASRSPTKAMDGAESCRDCDSFEWIVCERLNDKLRAATPCLGIGNLTGADAPTCEGPQGHHEGAAGSAFLRGEKIWILLRLRNLRPGKHILTTRVNGIYMREKTGSVEWAQKITFANAERDWWLWYESRTNDPGEWTEYISIDGEPVGYAEYCVSEERRKREGAPPPASPLQGLRTMFGL